ncbi:MAG: radical SAM protein [Bacteroidota bacterium]
MDSNDKTKINIQKREKYMKSQYLKNAKDVILKSEECTLPLYIQLETTTHCNLRCKMCVRNETIKNPKHLSFEKFKYIFDQTGASKVTLSGLGEPLLNPELPEILSYLTKQNVTSMIPSNGTMLSNEKIAESLIDSGLNILKISIDAASKDTYLKIRGQDKFDTIIDGLKKLKQIKIDKNTIFPEIRLDVVILKENVFEIPEVINLAKDLNINTVFFRALQTQGLEDDRKKVLGKNIDFDILLLKLNQAVSVANKLKIKTNLKEIVSNFSSYKSIYVSLDSSLQNKVCLLPYFQCFISIDGEVSPCCALFCNEKVSIGNVFENRFIDIWNGQKMQNIRRCFAAKENNFAVCKDCVPRSLSVLLKMNSMLPRFL